METNDSRASKKQITNAGHALVSVEDLLIEILLRLPIFSLYLFKYVSKQWFSLITSLGFTLRYKAQHPYPDPPSGLFLHPRKTQRLGYGYDFVSLDHRLPAKRYLFQTTFNNEAAGSSKFEILQSCNGLLLCFIEGRPTKFYVYNPSINMFKRLPVPHCSTTLDRRMNFFFDPTKSPNYKVIHVDYIHTDDALVAYVQIQTYSSETGLWNVHGDRFPLKRFEGFDDGIYWNDAIHWLSMDNGEVFHNTLEIVKEHQALTTTGTPRDFNENVQRDCEMFESRGCLLVLCRPHTDSCNLRIYEISYASHVWSLKYHVNLDDIIKPYLKTRRIPPMWCCSNVWCIVLGEREDDSFLVMELYGKVVQINIVSENSSMLCEFGLRSPFHKFQYIPSFASV